VFRGLSGSELFQNPIEPVEAARQIVAERRKVRRLGAEALLEGPGAGQCFAIRHHVVGCQKLVELVGTGQQFGAGGAVGMLCQVAATGVAEHVGEEHPLVVAVRLHQQDRCAGKLGCVLADADLALAVDRCVAGRFNNTGQTCVAAKRWIVVDALYDAFREAVLSRLAVLNSGDPMQADTDLGPMARADLRETLHRQVQQSIAAGASCTLGGTIPAGAGFYYPPTLLEQVAPGMPAFDDELFGPVAALIRAADDEEAVRLANDSRLGLGAAVFSRDIDKALAIAGRLQAGNVAINDFVRSDPRLPFGGVKESGYGRELATYGMLEFVNIKAVVCGV